MQARYLLDTDICIYVHRRRPAEVLSRFQRLRRGEAAISIVTYGELIYGAQKSGQRERAIRQIEEFANFIEVAPLPLQAARVYGLIRASLEVRGEPIGSNDLWIAAHAITAEVTLVTNNEREFSRIPELEIQNWTK